jgi:hypothetical protein
MSYDPPPVISKEPCDSMKKLIECDSEFFCRGSIFRAIGMPPYEASVDFMVFETLDEKRRFGLMVTTGYKAGLTLVILPVESNSGTQGLCREWVVKNWAEWIYPDCDVSQVLTFAGYEPGSEVNG